MRHLPFRFTVIAAIVAACLASSAAFGGMTSPQNVVVSQWSNGGVMYGFFSGSLGGARYSSDQTQYIGCEIISDSKSQTAYCWANDSTGHYASCSTIDATFIAMIANVNDASYLSVDYVSSDSTCTTIVTQASSEYMH